MFSQSNNHFTDLKLAAQNGQVHAISIEELVEALATVGIPGPRHLHLTNVRTRGEPIGVGAQFEVFRDTVAPLGHSIIKRVKRPLCTLNSTHVAGTSAVSMHFKTLRLEISSLGDERRRNHPNIAKIVEWGYDYPTTNPSDRLPTLLMERADDTLLRFLQRPEVSDEHSALAIKHQLCLDVASGLACVHSTGLAHGDIKPDNVLVSAQDDSRKPWIAKLSDFGLCIDTGAQYGHSQQGYYGTPGWQPPEVVSRLDTGSQSLFLKADSFVFGLLVIAVFFNQGQSPTSEGAVDLDYALSQVNKAHIESDLKLMLRRLCHSVLQLEPDARSEVDIHLLKCDIESFHNWALSTAVIPPPPAGNLLGGSIGLNKAYYDYWITFDLATLVELEQRYDDTCRSEGGNRFSAKTLFGMGLRFAVGRGLDYRRKVWKFFEAAARAGSLPAQGIIWHLCDAFNDKQYYDAHRGKMIEWLWNAARDGSYVALRKLKDLDLSKAESARRIFVENGGYNVERASINKNLKCSSAEGTVKSLALETPNSIIDEARNTPLHLAAMAGDSEMIRLLTSLGADIDVRNANGESPIYKACLAAQHKSVFTLLHLGADVCIRVGDYKISCLHWLFNFRYDHMNVIARLLIAGGLHVDVKTYSPQDSTAKRHQHFEHFPFHWPAGTPFHWACATGCFEAADILLKNGASIDEYDGADDGSFTAAQRAFCDVSATTLDFLVARGADLQRVWATQGMSGMHLLTLDYADLNRSFRLPRPLHFWIAHGSWANHIKELRRCIGIAKAGDVDINQRSHHLSKYGELLSPILSAGISRAGGAIFALLQEGANADDEQEWSKKKLSHMWAEVDSEGQCYTEAYAGVWQDLFDRLSHLGARDSMGRTISHYAVMTHWDKDFRFMTERLIAHSGIGILEARDTRGDTPLLLAFEIKSFTAAGPEATARAEHLLSLGADVAATNEINYDVIAIAVQNENLSDEQCLRLIGHRMKGLTEQQVSLVISTTLTSKKKSTALILAASCLRPRVVEYFLDSCSTRELDINACSNEDKTALDYALESAQYQRQWLSIWLVKKQVSQDHHFALQVPEDALFAQSFNESAMGSDSSVLMDSIRRERYFAGPKIIRKLLSVGAKRARDIMSDAPKLDWPPRAYDNEMRNGEGMDKLRDFREEQQPYYNHWKVLYELMDD